MQAKGQKQDIYPIIKKVVAELWDNEDSVEFRQPVDYKALNLHDYPILIKTPMDLSTVKKKIRTKKYKTYQEFCNDVLLIWENCIKYNQEGSLIFKIATKMEKVSKKVFKKYINQKVHHHHHHHNNNTSNQQHNLQQQQQQQIQQQQTHHHHHSKKEQLQYQQQILIPLQQQIYFATSPTTFPIINAPNTAITAATAADTQNSEYQPRFESLSYEEKMQFCQKIKGLSQNELIQVVKLIDDVSPQSILDLTKDKFKIKVDDLNLSSIDKIQQFINDINKKEQKN